MKKRIDRRTLLILILLGLVLLITFIPIEKLAGREPLLGMVVAKVNVKGNITNTSCNTALLPDWNLIGISCNPPNSSVESVFGAIMGNVTSIHSYEKNDAHDPWKSYNPNLPSWVVLDLNYLDAEKGYWVNMKNGSILQVNGTIESPYKISMSPGWNLVGYPGIGEKIPSSAFATIDGSYSIAWGYNATTDAFLFYNPGLGSGTLGKVGQGHGYWINMTRSGNLWIFSN